MAIVQASFSSSDVETYRTLVFVAIGFYVASGVFCRQCGCIRSSRRPMARRGAELERLVNMVSFSEDHINYPPKSNTAEELALQWIIEDDSG